MRLIPRDIEKIKRIFNERISHSYDLRLFGSRLDDNKLGGDIDLLLIVGEENLEVTKNLRHEIIDDLHGAIGEQKIDLIITTQDKISNDVFLSSIQDEAKIL